MDQSETVVGTKRNNQDLKADPANGIAAAEATADVHKSENKINSDTLTGRWLRPDGNYIIQINSISTTGQVDAQYFNPRPIRVARAEILPDDNLRVFIEFDDTGYEGSSYDLIYDIKNDVLAGNYYQATYGQTYQIAFIRLKE